MLGHKPECDLALCRGRRLPLTGPDNAVAALAPVLPR